MKQLSSFLLMPLLSFTACIYFPWWSIAPACFIISAFIPVKAWQSLLLGFLSLFLLWFILAWTISAANNHLLAHRISLLMIKSDNPYGLIFLTGCIGGLVGGLSAMTGTLARKMIIQN